MIAMAAAGLLLALSADSAQLQPGAPLGGTVTGRVRMELDGRVLRCVGVLLLPQNAAVDAEIRRVFGNNEQGWRTVRYRELQQRRRDRLRRGSGNGEAARAGGARETRCTNGLSHYGFSFSEVPPGDYYITTSLDPGLYPTGGPDGFQPRGVDLMRRVRVAPGETVQAELSRD